MANDVSASHGVLVDLFEQIQAFLTRLNIYSGIPLTTEMTTMLGKIMAEVLSILALSTKEMQEGRISEVYFTQDNSSVSDHRAEKFVKRLGGKTNIEDAMQRLDKLTQEETRTTAAKTLEVTHSIKECAQGPIDYFYTPR